VAPDGSARVSWITLLLRFPDLPRPDDGPKPPMGSILNEPDAISGAGPAVPNTGSETGGGGGGGEEGSAEIGGEGGGGAGGGGLPDIEGPGLSAD
jgi:hypothetical protein